jgi:uncharacterized paraquat-inducible protein A
MILPGAPRRRPLFNTSDVDEGGPVPRVFGILDTATARRLARPLTVAAVLLYAATMVLPFVHGTVRKLFGFSRSLTLLEFMQHVSEKQSLPVVVLVTAVAVVLPAMLLAAALLAAWAPLRRLPAVLRAPVIWLRWRGWMVTAIGVTFMLGLRAAASATGGPQLRLLPGGWCFCIALVVAALALTTAAPARDTAGGRAAPLF